MYCTVLFVFMLVAQTSACASTPESAQARTSPDVTQVRKDSNVAQLRTNRVTCQVLTKPSYISQSPGQMLEFEEDCHENATNVITGIMCEFLVSNHIVRHEAKRSANGTISCLTPLFTELGMKTVNVTWDLKNTTKPLFTAGFLVGACDQFAEDVMLLSSKLSSDNIALFQWNATKLGSSSIEVFLGILNLVDDDAIPVFIGSTSNTGKAEITLNKNLVADTLENAALVSFVLVTDKNRWHSSGQILATCPKSTLFDNIDSLRRTKRGITSWGVKNVCEMANCEEKCKAWAATAKTITEVPPCYATRDMMEQTIKNEGALSTWEKDTCNDDNPDWCDFFHPGSKICYRKASEVKDGPGSQCCYKPDNTFHSGPCGGGTADAVSPKGSSWKHFKDDVIPWVYCCYNCKEDPTLCELYYAKRPSGPTCNLTDNKSSPSNSQCEAKKSASALVAGDPHFTTFDGKAYTFNGAGEFLLFSYANSSFEALHVQIRCQPVAADQKVTYVTAVVATQSGGDKVQVEVYDHKLQVYINDYLIDLGDKASATLKGVELFKDYNSIDLNFNIGCAISVIMQAEKLLALSSVVCYKKSGVDVKGLLGNFDGNPDNDIGVPGGESVLNMVGIGNLEMIHKSFGMRWLVDANASMFTYHDGNSYSTYYNPNFDAMFGNIVPSLAAQQACNGNPQCMFDAMVTGDLDLAKGTLNLINMNNLLNTQLGAIGNIVPGGLPIPNIGLPDIFG